MSAATRPLAAWGAFLLALLMTPGCQKVGAQGGPGGPPPVQVVVVRERPIAPSEVFSARLEAVQTVEVRPKVGGTLIGVHFAEGQRVPRGALLFTLDAEPFRVEVARLQAQRQAAMTQGELARSELARSEKLLAIQAVSQQEIDQQRAAARNADAAVASAQAALDAAQLNFSYTRVTAPIAGRVSRAEVTPGNLVAAGSTLLTTLVATERIHAIVAVSESAYLRFLRNVPADKSGAAGVAVKMGLAGDTGLPHTGRIDFIDNRLDPASGTLRVRAVFDNSDGKLLPGLAARVQISGAAGAPAAVLPDRAIGTDQTRKVVLVVGANNVVEQRSVVPGALLDGMRVVSGVKAGEKVIVDGLQRAFPGAPVTPQELPTDAEGRPLPPPAQPGGKPAGG